MELIGDLERAFASAIYPNRYVVAAAAFVAVVVLAVVARRRRWYLLVRRHPRQAAVAAALALAVGLPLGWYLGSPLFLSTTVDDPAPIAAIDRGRPPPSTLPSDAPTARTGTFRGADDFHFARGTASLVTTPDGEVLRLEDFEVRNGPDLYVYLSPSPDGYAEGAIEVGRLKADRGNQNYDVPAGTDLASIASVVIWCRQFSVEFGSAPL